jgi:hypothetical protein
MLINSVSTRVMISLKIIRNLGTCSQKFRGLSPRPKNLENIGFKGRKIISLSGGPNY